MIPNENYLKYFPDEDLPEINERTKRNSALRIGTWPVVRKFIEEYNFSEILSKYINKKDLGLVLDLAAYGIICENNAGQYYPDYAYNHPLFSNDMHIYSDSKVSDLLQDMTIEMSAGFLNDWNAKRDHRERIYISYDSTNKNCQAGDLEIVEYGHPKVDMGTPIFNYAIAYDTENKEPLFYEEYSGSINDVSQLEFMIGKAAGYGYNFIIMVKGMNKLVNSLILEVKGTFENKWAQHIDEYDVYGTTIKRKLYETDSRERYFHLFLMEFLALIIRNKMYNCLKEERLKLDSRPNYMTVPAAIRELEKIEMVRLTDNKYRLDHAVTATQKTILKAFGMDAALVKHYAEEISNILKGVN